MNKALLKPVISVTILIIFAGYLFFMGSGRMALTDPDETFYAQTAKEMLERNEWSTPYLYGKPQFEKPILFYWLLEASFKVFGVNEFAARMPSALFALIGLVAIYFLGSLLFNRRAGLFSAIALATSVEYIVLSRACVTDMVLFTLMCLGALFFCYGYLRGKRRYYLLSSAAFALATLTKGPIAILLPLAAIALCLLLAKDLKAIGKMPIVWSIITFIAVALPWYLLAYKMHGKDFIEAFFGFHNITRFVQSEHKIGSQPYYNIPILFGGFFPWSVFLPFGFWAVFKKSLKGPESEKRGSIFLLSWFFVIFIFFSLSSTKLPTYIFPSFMSLALIAGVLWDDFLKELPDGPSVKGVKRSYYFLLSALVPAMLGALVYIRLDFPSILPGVFFACLFLLFGMFLSWTAFLTGRFAASFFLIAYSVAIFLYPMGRLVLPEVERYETSKAVSEKLYSVMAPGERLGCESNYLAGLAFYVDRIPVDLDKHHALVKFLNSEDRVWCVIKEKNHRDLYDPDINPDSMKPSYMIYKIGKRAIVTNRVPPDCPYIIKREMAI